MVRHASHVGQNVAPLAAFTAFGAIFRAAVPIRHSSSSPCLTTQ